MFLDQPKFKQVLYNLLSNAVKFTPDEGRVELTARPYSQNRFVVSVRDTGKKRTVLVRAGRKYLAKP